MFTVNNFLTSYFRQFVLSAICPFGKVYFSKMSFGKMDFGKVSFGKMDFGKVSFGMMAFGKVGGHVK